MTRGTSSEILKENLEQKCNDSHNLMQKALSFKDVVTFFVNGNDYRIHIWYMCKDGAINLLRNADLFVETVEHYRK